MSLLADPQFCRLSLGIAGLLAVASLIGTALAFRARALPADDARRATIANLNARIRAWWVMAAVFGGALVAGRIAVVVLFGLLSLVALREFITLAPTRRGDHRALFWAFFIITPAHYYFVGAEWYGMFVLFIPVYAFLFLPVRAAIEGDCGHFLERTAIIQWGLMACVYCMSYAPAVLGLHLSVKQTVEMRTVENARLLVFLVAVVQLSDVFQYCWGKTLGRHKIAPTVSPGKTWEGFAGGILTVSALGAALWWATPFTPLQAGGISLALALAGFAGGLVMSAIKRDRGVKDYGAVIEGHGGVMDRLDSLCFAAPVFFHIVRFWF
ncbi:phosphatidate cytidylyltransferase [Termitidicoccus mucosus]|uniref:Phosphatidate cytidylyltransferase n=1 Tax=Termitidicoccus mucosus TaxID=1184151 RepID=A0A178IIE6_9BACT|nr:phosphatidate cytidylyltransferase [Opitutaceae bacterium TSB47]